MPANNSSDDDSKFPYPLVAVAGKDAEEELKRLRIAGAKEGFTPVLLGDREQVEQIEENLEMIEQSVEELLAQAATINAEEWFEERAAEFGEDEDFVDDEDSVEGDPEPMTHLTVAHDVLGGRPHPRVFIARIPTLHSWEIPAYLRSGGWNDCPEAHVQVAVSKYWHSRYGAELASVSGDVVEYFVGRPPADFEAAKKLAREQFLYCTDIVSQGVGTVGALAKGLVNSKYWYFWWD